MDFTYVVSFNLHMVIQLDIINYYYPHFIEEKTEV